MDIWPTLVDLLGLRPETSFDGSSLLEKIDGESIGSNNNHVISEISRKQLCVEKGDWKLIVDYSSGKKELYALASDICEANNVIHEAADIAGDLEELIRIHLEKNKVVADIESNVTEDPQLKEKLRALGYM